MRKKTSREGADNTFDKGACIADYKLLAKECIEIYFKNKQYFSGGKIPKSEMFSDHSIQTLLRTQFDARCFDFIHDECLPLILKDKDYDEPLVPWSVYSLIDLLKELESHQLPKHYFGGLLLLYFKFCYGVKIIDPPLI